MEEAPIMSPSPCAVPVQLVNAPIRIRNMRILGAAFGLLLLAPPVFADPAKWREDLAFFRTELPKTHKNVFHTMSREEFDRAVTELEAKLPRLADHEVVVELARIVARIGDGHTHLSFGQRDLGFHMLPVRFLRLKDGIFTADGAKVLRIGGVVAEEAWKRVEEVTPRDNEWSLRAMTAVHLAVPEILHSLRIAPSTERVVIRTDKGDLDLAAGPMQAPPQPAKNFTYEYRPDTKTLLVRFNAVYWQRDGNGYTSPAAFFDEVFAFADANPVDKLLIDVRENGGGNNTLALPIVHGIIKRDALNQQGKLFVLIGRRTFSAAQNFVNLMETHTKVTFAGEPTGSRPNHYGDPRPVTLPNSKLVIRASSLWWQDVHPADDRVATLPHISVDVTSADYFAGRDPVVEAVLRYQPLSKIVSAALPKGTAAEEYRRFKSDPAYTNLSTESEINSLGYSLLREQRTADALTVLRLNVESYPASANAHDSLAEALLAQGKRDEAISHYEKALELEPRNSYRREVLEKAKATSGAASPAGR